LGRLSSASQQEKKTKKDKRAENSITIPSSLYANAQRRNSTSTADLTDLIHVLDHWEKGTVLEKGSSFA
jgi:hypothetical protein